MKNKILKYAGIYSALAALSFLRALATYVFIVPNSFAPGGVGGIASIIYNAVLPSNPEMAATWLNPAVTVFVINVPLLIIAFKKVDRNFAVNTTLGVIFYAGFMGIMSATNFPVFSASSMESSNMILAALAGGVLSGISLGLMILLNMSNGGTDIIGRAVYRANPVINVNWIIFLSDCVVVVLSGILGIITAVKGDSANDVFVKIITPIFYSFITLFITSKVADFVRYGIESSVVFNIITDKYNEMSDAIIKEHKRGATILSGEGHYTGMERHIVVCVARKRQMVAIKRLVKRVDPQAFMYITNAREVNGQGFHNTEGL